MLFEGILTFRIITQLWKDGLTMVFHAFGAVKERANVHKLYREKARTKCSDDLVPSGLFMLNNLEIND